MKRVNLLLLAVIMVGVLSGCGSLATPLSDTDKDAVLSFSEPKTDSLLKGMNANDYAMFSQDFDQDMLSAMTSSQFDALKKDRDATLGLYVSRTVDSVLKQGDFYVVNYTAVFKKEGNVMIRVVFRIDEPHQVSGLWFNK